MTTEEEIVALRLENQELRIKIRKHRAIGETEAAEARKMQHHLEKVVALLRPTVSKDNPACRPCAKALEEVILCIRPDLSDSQSDND